MLERITIKNNLLKNRISMYYESQKKQQIGKKKEKWMESPSNTAVENGFSGSTDEKYRKSVQNRLSGSKTAEKWK